MATLANLRHVVITSSASLAKSLRALQAVGLIEKARQGGVASGGKLCSLYRFTDQPVLDHPKQGVKAMAATDDWKRFRTHGEARSALKDAHYAALRPATKVKRKVQSLNRLGSSSELSAEVFSSDAETGEPTLAQGMNTGETPTTALEAA